jgi:hypothetical protein
VQTRQVVASTTIIAIIALALGASVGYSISSERTTTVTSYSTIVPSGLTTTATIVTISNVTQATTVTTGSELYQPCNNVVWNTSSPTPYYQHVPVLLMRSNSTAYVCVVYQTAWQGNESLYSIYNSSSFLLVNGTYQFGYFPVGNYKCSTANGSTTCTETDSHSFVITALPESIRPTASMNYVTVVYIVTALSNSTGFYDRSAPWTGCLFMPIAVGYTASEVNASDFTQEPLHSCFVQFFIPIAEYSTGMSVTYVNFTQP